MNRARVLNEIRLAMGMIEEKGLSEAVGMLAKVHDEIASETKECLPGIAVLYTQARVYPGSCGKNCWMNKGHDGNCEPPNATSSSKSQVETAEKLGLFHPNTAKVALDLARASATSATTRPFLKAVDDMTKVVTGKQGTLSDPSCPSCLQVSGHSSACRECPACNKLRPLDDCAPWPMCPACLAVKTGRSCPSCKGMRQFELPNGIILTCSVCAPTEQSR